MLIFCRMKRLFSLNHYFCVHFRLLGSASTTARMGDFRWLIGAGLNLVGSMIINLGTNIIKLSHNKKSKSLWNLGMAIFAAGNIANFSSFSFAAQSLLAALGSVQFITNLILATIFLGEKVTTRIIIGTVTIVVGNVLAVAFGNRDSERYSADELMDLYTEAPFIVYLCLLFPFAIVVNALYMKLTHEKNLPGFLANHRDSLRPLTYAASSASVGCLSVLCAKSSSQLLFKSLAGDNQFNNYFTYIVTLMFIILTVFWLVRMNRGLSQFDALIIVPQLQVFWTTFSIMSGGIYFKEFDNFSSTQFFWFVFGVLIVLCGVYFVCSKKQQVNIRGNIRAQRPVPEDTDLLIEDDSNIETRRRAISSAFANTNMFTTFEVTRESNVDEWVPNKLWENIKTMIPPVPFSAPIASVDAKWAHDEDLTILEHDDVEEGTEETGESSTQESQHLLSKKHPQYASILWEEESNSSSQHSGGSRRESIKVDTEHGAHRPEADEASTPSSRRIYSQTIHSSSASTPESHAIDREKHSRIGHTAKVALESARNLIAGAVGHNTPKPSTSAAAVMEEFEDDVEIPEI